MRILFLSRWYPYPTDNGSKLRVFNLLQGLSRRHQVALISFVSPGEVFTGIPAITLDRISVCPQNQFRPWSRRAIFGSLSRMPRYLVDTYQPEMDALIRNALRQDRFDLVIASQVSMAAYYHSFSGVPAIFDEAELGVYWPYHGRGWIGTTLRRRLTWEKHRRYVARLLRHFALCTVASDIERQLLQHAAPTYDEIYVIPNTVDVDGCGQVCTERAVNSLIFTGPLSYWPNHDALVWFLSDIYPVLEATLPGVKLTVTGDTGSRPLPSRRGVSLLGRVTDVRSRVAASAVSIAPIRYGGGTRVKILESLALRTPVVATSKAVEGLELVGGEHLLIADTPAEFARAVVRLIREPAYARSIADNGFKRVQSRYHSGVVLPSFLGLVDKALTAPTQTVCTG